MAITDKNSKTSPTGVTGVNSTSNATGSTAGSYQEAFNANQNTAGATSDMGNMVGFGINPIFAMASNTGSEYTNKVAKDLIEAYKSSLPETERPKVTILDKEVNTKLAYSTLVVSLPVDSASVNYYIILLEATGREPLTAADIMAEVHNSMRQNGSVPFIYTPDDAIDKVLQDEVRIALANEYGAKKFISVDGLVVPNVQHDDVNMSIRIAAIAFNACRAEKALISGTRDLNIRIARQQTPNMILKLESNLLKQTIKNEVDRAIRSDWQVELNAIDTTNNVSSLNLQNAKTGLTRSCGFIDAIPQNVEVPTMPNMPSVVTTRLHPHIIIDNNDVYAPTPGYTLLGLISSLVMTNENMWIAALMPREDRKSIRNIGSLNILTNIENDAKGIGHVIDLHDKKLKPEEVYGTLKKMFTLDPVVSYDIESFGPQTHYSSMFALAAQPGNGKAKVNAAKEIVKAANWLTDGNFPKDFPIENIFVNNGIVVPLGVWSDKTGERDIRDIDAAFIATQTTDPDLVKQWVLTALPEEATGMDPYITKVEIISKLIPNAIISGKAIRTTFTSDFINTLISAAVGAGLDARYEPEIKFVETSNLGIMNNYLAGAGVSNAGMFAQQNANARPTFTTPYSHVGMNRYY